MLSIDICNMSFRFAHSFALPKAENLCDQGGGADGKDLLSIYRANRQVVWYGPGGCKVLRRYTFVSIPVDAKFCQFKSNASEIKSNHPDAAGDVVVKHAIAILLLNGDLQICLYSGEVHELTLPCPIKRMLSVSNGLLLQRSMVEEGSELQCFWMSNPLSPLTIVETSERYLDSDILCVREDWLCSYSRSENTVSVLSLQATANGSSGITGESALNGSNLSNGVSPTPVHRSRNDTPNVLLDLSRAELTNQKYRSPMVYSRESSLEFELSRDPTRSDSSRTPAAASSQYGGSDAALRSLLTPANLQSRQSTGTGRSGSNIGGLMNSVRSQPMLYSRGTSGNSSNSNSAYHIRKKRAAQGHSPVPSPRPSPSGFMFDSSASARNSFGMAMDVDQPSFRAIDSPQNISNHSFNHLQDLSANGGIRGTGGASFSDTSNAELAGPAEVYLTCLARVKLPTGPTDNVGCQLSASFTGSFDSVGGLCLNIFNKAEGVYTSYRLYEEGDEVEIDGEMRQDTSFFPAVGSEPLRYSLELKYTNAPAEGAVLQGSTTKFIGVAHVTASLESDGQAILHALGVSTAALPQSLRSAQWVPLTLLLTAQGRVQVLIGAQAVQEVQLAWQDDLAELEGEAAPAGAELATSLSTIHTGSTLFVATCQGQIRVLSLLPLFGPSQMSVDNPGSKASVSPLLLEVVKAAVATLRLMNTEGLIECVLGFLINVHAEIGSLWTLSWLLAASFGIQYDLFVLALSSAKTHKPPQPQAASYLQQIYQVFAADAVRLYEASADHCIGAEIFSAVHAVLQDRLLRGDGVVGVGADVSTLRDIMRSTVLLVSQYQASFNAELPLSSAYSSLLSTHGEYYKNNSAHSSPNLDAVAWCRQSIEAMTAAKRSSGVADCVLRDFSLPPLHNGHGLLPCPTIRLTARFLQYLSRPLGTTIGTPARTILDAFVFVVHEKTDNAVKASAELGGSTDWLVTTAYFPSTFRRIINLAVEQCQADPNPAWPLYLLKLVKRKDLCGVSGNQIELLNLNKSAESATGPVVNAKAAAATAKGAKTDGNTQAPESDGLLEVEKASMLRFTEDDRVHEICRMLRSSQPSYLKFEKPPEVSELDHRHKLQMKLLSLVRRALANPVGRGMLTIASLEPLMAEALPIPPLCLAGRVPPANSILQFDASTAHGDLTLWPDFHNGVAAALRVGPASDSTAAHDSSGGSNSRLAKRSKITRNWIMYNRTASVGKLGGDAAHAGFLLGLGLWGHLTNLTVSDTYDYLVQGHEPTTVAVLIGTAASKIGTADPLLSKTISLHMPALLPAQHGEIEISPSVQAAALVSLGLLHCASGHRLMTEFLLAELSRSPLSDRCECRESMVLSAAWALGMVLLGKGRKVSEDTAAPAAPANNPATPAPSARGHSSASSTGGNALKGLADLRVESRLLQFIDGGKRPGESSLFPIYITTDISSRSSRMLEGADINTNVTAPGAIIALALIYIRSNDTEILQRLALPTTVIALDAVRPDLLIYRALAACLIKWDLVVPTADWVNAQIPDPIRTVIFPADTSKASGAPKDLKLLYQNTIKRLDGRTALALYLNAFSGYCYGIGVVFAGTANEQAKQTILGHLKLLQSFRDNKPLLKLPFTLDKSLRQSVESCICLVGLSVSCVMAGSGDLECLRTLRELRWKVEDVTYGTHMALSMAIGMLFLGGGNYSLRRDPLSAACLLLSLCPRFPLRTVDHQYHLQALRHLYVLAAEPRALHTIDVDTGLTVSVKVQVELVDGRLISMVAPGLLPELSSIRRISVVNPPEDAGGDQDGGSGSGSAVAPPLVRYYPTSVDIQHSDSTQKPANDNSPQSVEELLRSTKSRVLRNSHTHTTVPPLFVKRVPKELYSAEANNSAEGLNSLTRVLQLTALPHGFSSQDSTAAAHDNQGTREESKVCTALLLVSLRSEKGSADAIISTALMEHDVFSAVVLGAVSANS